MIPKLGFIAILTFILLIASVYISMRESHRDTPITEAPATYKVCGLGGCHYTEWYDSSQGCVYYGKKERNFTYKICGTYSVEKLK